MATMLADVPRALRTLLRAPAFTLTVVLTLALGIGATTAMFSVVNGVEIKPLPYPEADRVMTVTHSVGSSPVSPWPRPTPTSAACCRRFSSVMQGIA